MKVIDPENTYKDFVNSSGKSPETDPVYIMITFRKASVQRKTIIWIPELKYFQITLTSYLINPKTASKPLT